MPGTVVTAEDLGNYRLVTARLAGHPLKAKLPEDAEVPTGEAHLSFDPDRLLLYADGRLVT